jgi:outer membrane lipoprotein-sorting protein
MKFLRTLSTSRLLLLLLAVAVLAAGVGAIAVAASGGSGPTPPAKPLAGALHDSLAAPSPEGITARIKFTNKLFPSGALEGRAGSALMSGASGRLWATNDGRGRLELQSDAGDVQVVWNRSVVTVFDASSNTVYRAKLPAQRSEGKDSGSKQGIPTVAQIRDLLAKLGAHVEISAARPVNVGSRPAYSVRVAPKHDGGLLGAAELAWDAARPVPLRVGIYAQGASSPVLELRVSHISYGAIPTSDVAVSPPAGAKTIDLGSLGTNRDEHHGLGRKNEPQGLQAVQAAAPFLVTAPAKLVGLPRQDVRLVGGADSNGALVVYGHGLGAIVVFERKAAGGAPGAQLGSLPEVSIDGATGHELATQLGTILTWKRGGVSYVLAGSLPSAAAEAAARELK